MGAAGIAALPILAKAASAEEIMDTSMAEPVDLSGLKRIKHKLVRPPMVHAHEQTAPAEPRVVEFELQIVEKEVEVDDGAYAHVTMTPCSGKICGVISRTFNGGGEYDSPNKGKTLVINMVPNGGGKYSGKVWRPSNDKIYIGKMQISGTQLSLKGCVAGGLICANQNWKKLQ